MFGLALKAEETGLPRDESKVDFQKAAKRNIPEGEKAA